MNAVLGLMGNGMRELELGLSGALNISDAMDALIGFLFINSVPPNWLKICGQIGPTGNYNRKNLANWFVNLKERFAQLDEWAKVRKAAGARDRRPARARRRRLTECPHRRPPAPRPPSRLPRLCSAAGPVHAAQLGVDRGPLQPDGLCDCMPADDRARKGPAARQHDDLDRGDALPRRELRGAARGGHLRARPLHGGRQVVG